jgi:hypothetical protein
VHEVFSSRAAGENMRKHPINIYSPDTSTVSAAIDVALVSSAEVVRGAEKTCDSHPAENDVHAAVHTLSKMQLRARFPGEETAHRNMLSRCKQRGAVIHPEFRDFGSFLSHVGEMPARKATLDRINNTDPEYAPGKVRWADKRTQNGNKGDTLLFYYSRTGDTYTTSRLAKLQKVTQNAVRTRHLRGWSDDEIIEGKRNLQRFEADTVRRQKSVSAFRVSPNVPKTAAAILFERDRESCQTTRETEGGEYFLMTPKEFGKLEPKHFPPSRVKSSWKFFMQEKLPKWWIQYKPHIVFDRLKPFKKKLIRQIDPSMRD